MKTEQAIQEFFLSRGGIRPKTLKDYRMHLTHFQKAFTDLTDSPQLIQSYLNSFTIKPDPDSSQGVTPETVHARFRTIRALYNQIHLWHPDIPNPIPLVRPPQLKKKTMRTFADEEIYRLFSLPLSPRDRALITLLLDVGARAGECANLTWEDVMPGYAVLRGKTGTRTVPISETTYRQLQALRSGNGTGRHHVFLGKRGPLTSMGIYKLVRHLCQQADINGRRCSPHTFRHTFGTVYAASEGCDPKVLQDIMGHKDFKTTLRYIQNNPRRMAQNHQRCTPLKLLAIAAQGFLFGQDSDTNQAVQEAEEILERNCHD